MAVQDCNSGTWEVESSHSQQTGSHPGLCDATQPHTVAGDISQWVKCLLHLLGTHVCKSLCHVAHTYSHAVKTNMTKYVNEKKRREILG